MKMGRFFYALIIATGLVFGLNGMAEDESAVVKAEPTEAGLNGGSNACPNCMIQDSLANKSPQEVRTLINDTLKKDGSDSSKNGKGVK